MNENALAGINKPGRLKNLIILSKYTKFYIFITTSFRYDKELV